MSRLSKLTSFLAPISLALILFGGAETTLETGPFISLICALGIVGGLAIARPASGRLRPHPADILFALAGGLIPVGYLISPALFEAEATSLLLLGGIGFFYYSRNRVNGKTELNTIGYVIALIGAAAAASSILPALFKFIFFAELAPATGFFEDPGGLAAMLLLSFSLSAGFYQHTRTQPGAVTWPLRVCLIIIFFGLLATADRYALLSLVIAGIITTVLFRAEGRRLSGRLFFRSGLALVAAISYWPLSSFISGRPFLQIESGRLDIFRAGYEIILRKPFFGHGFGSFGPELLKFFGDPLKTPAASQYSFIIQTLSEGGLAAFFIISTLAIISLLIWRDRLTRRHDPVIRGVLAGASFSSIGLLILSLFENPFASNGNLILFSLIVGVGYAAALIESQGVDIIKARAGVLRAGFGYGLSLFCVIGIFWGAAAYLAVAYEKVADKNLAAGETLKAIKSHHRGRIFLDSYRPNYAKAAADLQTLAAEAGRQTSEDYYKQSVELAEWAISIDPYYSEGWLLLARAEYALGGNVDKSAELLAGIDINSGRRPELQLAAADLLLKMKYEAEACEKISVFLAQRKSLLGYWVNRLTEAGSGSLYSCLPADGRVISRAAKILADSPKTFDGAGYLFEYSAGAGLALSPDLARAALSSMATTDSTVSPSRAAANISAGYQIRPSFIYRTLGAARPDLIREGAAERLLKRRSSANIVAYTEFLSQREPEKGLGFIGKTIDRVPGAPSFLLAASKSHEVAGDYNRAYQLAISASLAAPFWRRAGDAITRIDALRSKAAKAKAETAPPSVDNPPSFTKPAPARP